jgi:hypothetical protein
MNAKRSVLVLIMSMLLAAGCSGGVSQQEVIEVISAVEQTAVAGVTFVPVSSTPNLDQIVQATFQAMTAQALAQPPAVVPSATQGATDNIPTFTPPAGQSGSISGSLSYPAEGIPAMAVVAYAVGGGQFNYYYVLTQQGQGSYQIDNLPVGQYHIVAYTMGGGGFPVGLAGGYTQAVPCGLSVNCTDHSLIAVQVNNGQVSTGANPQDWYAPEGTFPPYPLP